MCVCVCVCVCVGVCEVCVCEVCVWLGVCEVCVCVCVCEVCVVCVGVGGLTSVSFSASVSLSFFWSALKAVLRASCSSIKSLFIFSEL